MIRARSPIPPALTVTKINAARPEVDKDTFLADGGGLFLKIAAVKPDATKDERAKARKSFVFRYTYGNRRRLMTLGTFPQLELAEARQKHLEARKTLATGADPLQINQAAQQALKAALTVEQLGDEWLTRVIDKQFKKPEEVRRMLAVDIYPRIGKFLARDITSRRSHIRGIRTHGSHQSRRGGPGQPRRRRVLDHDQKHLGPHPA